MVPTLILAGDEDLQVDLEQNRGRVSGRMTEWLQPPTGRD
jgi:hypothetical protein